MANSDQLRENINQHKPKNKESKLAEKEIYLSMLEVKKYLEEKFSSHLTDYKIEYSKDITLATMVSLIKTKNIRRKFDDKFLFYFGKSGARKERKIIPDGGLLTLKKKNDKGFQKIILISEIKHQGTNDSRMKEGKTTQATGNAVERLGKNLIGIRAMFNYEEITPFVCFGSGWDFREDDNYSRSKIFMINEFYPLNEIHVRKRDGSSDLNSFSPVSMFFRQEKWTRSEMFEKMKVIAEAALNYYLF